MALDGEEAWTIQYGPLLESFGPQYRLLIMIWSFNCTESFIYISANRNTRGQGQAPVPLTVARSRTFALKGTGDGGGDFVEMLAEAASDRMTQACDDHVEFRQHHYALATGAGCVETGP